MKKLLRWLLRGALVCVVLVLGVFWLLYLSPRPPLTTEPAALAGDGSVLDYCELPVLGGGGARAGEIPKANTPGCSYTHFPLPILRACTEPLPPEADDIRGLWLGVSGARVGHIERIEQCGRRTVVTAAGIIHDAGPNSTRGETTNDTQGAVLFTVGAREFCPRTSASMVWRDGVLEFHALGWGPVVVRRWREGAQLVWEYADGKVTRMNRICTLPEHAKIPAPRGPRWKFFAPRS